MNQIRVEMMAFIRRPDDLPRIFTREFENNISIKNFLKDLGFDSKEIRMMQFFISKNGGKESSERVRQGYELQDGDNLFITLPIGGGS